MTAPIPAQIESVRSLLPADADDLYGWDDAVLIEHWTGGIYSTVRAYWYQRCSETAGYIDLSDASGSLPASQIFQHAREMLEYWDAWLLKYGDTADPNAVGQTGRVPVTFGKIRNRYRRDCTC